MPGIYTPFTKVKCPICTEVIDCGIDRDSLARHIRDGHKDVPLVPIARSLYLSLNQIIPSNLERVEFDEMATVVANICKDAANKKGLNDRRKQRRGKRH